MNSETPITLSAKAAAQYRWAIANIIVALLCTALAAGAFMFGHVFAGLLILALSGAAVWNADAHKKRGNEFARGKLPG